MKPQRIVLIRHGESEGNVCKKVYKKKPDYALNLTDKGREQISVAATHLQKLLATGVGIYSSPFYRTRQTAEILEQKLSVHFLREDPRLREQERTTRLREEGEMDGVEDERDRLGSFYYRFKNGESCADVYDRISTFLDTLHRDFEKTNFPCNALISGHGQTNRVLLMRWFHWTVEQFEILRNPPNGGIYVLVLGRNGKYTLETEPERYEKPTRVF